MTYTRFTYGVDWNRQRHAYESGIGHMVHPDDVVDCCPFGLTHEIHHVEEGA